MLHAALIALAHELDELSHGVVVFPRLCSAKFFVLLLHQAANFAVLRLGEVVLVRPRERLEGGEETPVRVKLANRLPRRVRGAERGRVGEAVLPRREAGSLLVRVNLAKEVAVDGVEGAGLVAEAAEGGGGEEGHKVELVLGARVLAAGGVHAGAEDGLAMAVVPRALVRIAQGLVRRANLLEAPLSLLQAMLVLIGVPFQSEAAVRLL